ncbi:MAG: DUF2723 domain-containing protein [Pseudomonadota bacterium]
MTSPEPPPPRPPLLLESAAVFAVFGVLYAAGAATTVQGGDASEFMAIAGAGGVAHPPGYPLFSMLVRLAALLPFGTVAWRASLVAALQAALALGVLHACVGRLTGSRVAALVAAGSLGFSLHFWRYATVSDVFAGACLTSTLVLAAAVAAARPRPGPREALLAGLALASGVAHHHTVVFLAPLAAYQAWRLLRGPRPLASLGAGLAGLAPGFALYGLLMLPGGAWRWGDTTTWAGLLHHFLRRDYGTLRVAGADFELVWWAHPLDWLSRLPGELAGLYALLALLGLVVAQRRGPWRPLLLALTASLACSGPLFLALFNLPATWPDTVITARFHLVATTLLSVFTGIGAAWLLGRLPRARSLSVLLLASLILPLALNLPRAPHRGWTVLDDYLHNLLADLPPGSLVLCPGDSELFAMRYLQAVTHERVDVAFVDPAMLGYPWYRDLLAREHPDLVLDRSAPGLAAANLARVPVFAAFDLFTDPALAATPAYPWGAVTMRLLPPGAPLPSPATLEPRMRAALAGYTLRSRVDTPFEARQTYEVFAWDQYARAFATLAGAWRAAGDPEAEARCRATAQELSPHLYEEP